MRSIYTHDLTVWRQQLQAGLINDVSLPAQLGDMDTNGGGQYGSRPLINEYLFRQGRILKSISKLPSFNLTWVLFVYRQQDHDDLEQELVDWLHQQLLDALPPMRGESLARLPTFCAIALRHYANHVLERPPVLRREYATALGVSLDNWDKQWTRRLNRATEILRQLDVDTIQRLIKFNP